MSEVDDVIAAARASWDRIAADRAGAPIEGFDPRARARAVQTIGRRLTRIAVADAAILALAVVLGLAFGGIGLLGAVAFMMLLIAATVVFAVWPAERAPRVEQLRTVDLKALPAQTERWLQAQRPALPAPAVTLVDQIGVRLDALVPQLAALAPNAPAADEVRKLVAEQLPKFVRGYQRVPIGLRSVPRNGKTPDAQLVDGLSVIERQLGEASARLAEGDLDALSTRGRYLELKYQGDQPT